MHACFTLFWTASCNYMHAIKVMHHAKSLGKWFEGNVLLTTCSSKKIMSC